MGGKIYGWKLINNKMGKVIWNPKRGSLWPSTNDFASYGGSSMLIPSVFFTWLKNKQNFIHYIMYRLLDFSINEEILSPQSRGFNNSHM